MKYLKIGGHQVRLILKDVNNEDYIGLTDFNIPSITIDKDTCQSFKESSLIHEAGHIMNTTLDGSEIGHIFLDSFAEQMYQFLNENGLLNKQAFLDLFSENDTK